MPINSAHPGGMFDPLHAFVCGQKTHSRIGRRAGRVASNSIDCLTQVAFPPVLNGGVHSGASGFHRSRVEAAMANNCRMKHANPRAASRARDMLPTIASNLESAISDAACGCSPAGPIAHVLMASNCAWRRREFAKLHPATPPD